MTLIRKPAMLWLICCGLFMLTGCERRQTRVELGDREQILHLGNGAEPEDLDPQTTEGDVEHKIHIALFEGLVSQDPQDLHPIPGVAEHWDISPDGLVYTFHLRNNARWSNGEAVTAGDFIESWKRELSPTLGSKYSYMLYVMKNAESFNTNGITDFSQVGAKAVDDHTLEVTLSSPAPYFLSLITHNSWFPVHIPTIRKYGPLDDRSNRWTIPGHFVGNGPFRLKEWKVQNYVRVERSPTYWDTARIRLKEIYFYPTESADGEERAFRAGMLHVTRNVPHAKIEVYKREHPNLISAPPLLATYFYRFNVTKPPLNDKRVRQALALAIDREQIVTRVTRGGQQPAYNLTPPNTAGYTSRSKLQGDLAQAKKLMAEAGYPDGQNFPTVNILFNTLETHKAIAEAIQQMWRRNLNINVTLRNEEFKVYLTTTEKLDYQIARAGWTGDYVDPDTFLNMFITDGGQNETGWSNNEYDKLIQQAAHTSDMNERFEVFQKAEAILTDEVPIMPIYFYTQPILIQPMVKGWYPTVLDIHPYKEVYLDPAAK